MSKKTKKIDHQIDSISQISLKNKGVFPDDKSIQKIIFLALRNGAKKMDYAD